MLPLENGKLLCSSHLTESPFAAVFSAVSLRAFHVEMVFKEGTLPTHSQKTRAVFMEAISLLPAPIMCPEV